MNDKIIHVLKPGEKINSSNLFWQNEPEHNELIGLA